MGKKTVLSLIAAVVVLVVILVLVFGGSGSSKSKTVTWWVPNWDEKTVKELLVQFKSENPDMNVEMVTTTWETMENKIRVALSTNNAPDVITDLESRIKSYAKQGYLSELDSYYTGSMDKSDFITSALDINSYNGKIYGMPFRHDGSGVLYNKKMFKAAGLDPDHFPKTWDEFIQAAKKLTVDTNNDGTIDQYGMGWPFGNQTNAMVRYMQMLYSYGGELLNADGSKTVLDTPEAIEAMQKMTDTIKMGVAPRTAMEVDNTGLRDLFMNGKIAMYIAGVFDIEPIKKGNPSIDIGSAVIPGPNGMAITTVDGFSMIVPKSAANKDGARKLIEFIARPENMGQLTQSFPGRKSALNQEKFKNPLFKPFTDQLERGKAKPVHVQWPEIEKTVYRYMQSIILENKDVPDAMKKLNAEINGLLK